MGELAERAHETIEAHAPHGDGWARGVAVLVSCIAAVLALAQIGEKASQNAYMTEHIALSDDWAFYQAKNQRAANRAIEAELLASLPNAADPAVQARIRQAQETAALMRDDLARGDGMKQLAEKAKAREADRDEYAHRYHHYEYAVGALELAIVIASVSVVTRNRAMSIGAGVIGAAAAVASLCIAVNVF